MLDRIYKGRFEERKEESMELQELLYKRQSIRRFKEGDVKDEDIIEMILTAEAHHPARTFRIAAWLLRTGILCKDS